MKTWIALVAVVAHLFCFVGDGWARPFTRIVSPAPNQVVAGPDVIVKFEAGGMQLGPTAWNLHFKLDDEPFQVQYDGNHAHVFKNVAPGSHTVRVYAANAMHEAIQGTQSTVTFHIAYADGANTVAPGHPTLTYNLPQGEYLGIDAGDVTLDFLVENVALSPTGCRVAYYVDGRRFLAYTPGPYHLKNLAPGLHRVRIELQDAYGDIISGPFNSEERIIAVSPDSIEPGTTGVDDGYRGVPRIDSIKGSMTMGRPWSATEQTRPLTPDELKKQSNLTVRDGEGSVARFGEVNDTTVTRQPLAPGPIPDIEDLDEEFQAREGEEVELIQNLDDVRPSNIRSGTIVVEPESESGVFLDTDEEQMFDPEELDEEPLQVRSDAADAEESTATTVRRRADGTTTTVQRTTATLRLEDRPGVRERERPTTRTVRMQDSATTATRDGDNGGTRTRGRRRESPGPELTDDTSGQDAETTRRRERRRARQQEILRRADELDTYTTGTEQQQD